MARSTATKKQRHSKKKTPGRNRAAKGSSGRVARVQGAPAAVHPRKQPRQQRSQQMVEAIRQAAAEVFARLGYARATTNKIAARAGVSVGSLYQYFPNKDSLLAALLEQHHAEVHAVLEVALARIADPATPLDEGLHHLLADLMALHEQNPALTRALSAEVLSQSPAAQEVHKSHDDVRQLQQVSALLAARPDVRGGDHLAMAAVVSQTAGQLTRWLVHDVPPGLDRSVLIEEVVQLLTHYLRR